ncbi:thymidine phosphorylase [Acidimicrobiia bacterium EGI L10123]|uniref:thymidine phosphorylase n=1 Tax=Salinilacustrithrix flava TaxID=2957203 RepID=UPI003D7C226F|nr:thymidine phosphorylase [Acidimicrobiia bacterium EGI L10123]
MATDILDVLRTKRDGGRLDDEQIRFFIDGYTAGTIADEQAAALLMAIVWRGMEPDELATWTAAMIDTGERADLSFLDRPTVDKHSTGGVGDKISLILVPLVAACGAAVPQLAGRGLGHTGGTLDKLEAIAGFQSVLPADRYRQVLADVGGVIAGASGDIAPADRKLYALRDVTATVESIPLIASSIMSKKIAEGTSGLVLDVKLGSGSFLGDDAATRVLAETMVGIGNGNGVDTVALLTDMDQPLGRAAGNALEVQESLDVLAGGGPADVRELTLALAREMLALAGIDTDPEPVLDDGRAMEVFERIVAAQGGDLSVALPTSAHTHVVAAERDGWLQRMDCKAVGIAVWRLGAGRARKEDAVSFGAGALVEAKVGERVSAGDPVLVLHADDPDRFAGALAALEGAIDIGDERVEPRPLIADRIT